MDYQAVLFDLDGTLLDTIEDLAEAMNVALAALNCPPRTVDECRFFVGDGVESFARRSLPPERRDAQSVRGCVERMQADYTTRWTAKTRPYDGVGELLNGLSDRGLATAVLSNKPDEFTRKMVGHFLPEGRFRMVLGAREGVPKKPDPSAAIEIASQLAIAPSSFLYLGDTDTDMRTAIAAGMFAVGATWGFRPREELTANGARMLIDRPEQLLTLVR